MKKIISLTVLFLMTNSCIGQNTGKFVPNFKPSKTTTHKINENQNYTFGYLEVLENRDNPVGFKIKLPVYIFKSRNPNPKKDPIIYTVGGPGKSTMRSAQYMDYYKYLDDRDFILFEQRGTQYANPNLDCPEWAQAIYQSNLPDFDSTKKDSILKKAALDCKTRLTKKGIDLNQYHTNAIAADIEDLRKALEIETYNLLTISYSTKIAQVLLRDYPDHIRSVVMDSPLPLEVNYDEESVTNILETLNTLLSHCELDVDCKMVFPNLKNRFLSYLQEKTKNPLVVTINNPNTGNTETFNLKGSDLITVFTSASTLNIMNVPFEINNILNNDLSYIKEQLAYLFQEPGEGNGLGMRLSVWCAEEYPFNSQEIIESETNKYPEILGLSPAVFESQVCDIWGVKKVSSIENKPIITDIPVLLISGEYDSETPPKWAEAMASNLNNSFHFIFKGWRHTPTTNWSNPCAMEAANIFFNDPNIKPSPDCLESIGHQKFKLE